MIEAIGVTKSFHDRPVLNSLSLRVGAGETVAVAGPNGSGKSTLLRILAGLLDVDGGTVTIDGRDATGWPLWKRARAGMGYLRQGPSAFAGLTALQNLRCVAEIAGVDAGDAALRGQLDDLGLGPVADRHAARLSGGERRRLELARVLCLRPRVLALDEPLAHLDRQAAALAGRAIARAAEGGAAVVIAAPEPPAGLAARTVNLAEGGKES